MSSEPDFWHSRYKQQAAWTRSAREYLYRITGLSIQSRVLEVGCGTGAVMLENNLYFQRPLAGVDRDIKALRYAGEMAPINDYLCAAGENLPFRSHTFDLTYCHFLLLWVSDPVQVVREMKRVTHDGGWVAAFAEPDYGRRIDYPPELEELGHLQTAALEKQGAHPRVGRELLSILRKAGLTQIRCGLLSREWHSAQPDPAESDEEWKIIRKDLDRMVDKKTLEQYRKVDMHAAQDGDRILFIPTFYAIGRVP